MMKLTINGNEYKVSFGYNSFCDSDLMERVQDMMLLMNGAESDKDVSTMGRLSELFIIVRELLFEGFKEENPVDSLQEVGKLLDIYYKETPKDEEGKPTEERGVLALFILIANDLMSEGFLPDLMEKLSEAVQNNIKSIPQDHKRGTRKKK